MPSFLAEDGPGKTSSMTPGLSSLKDRFTRKPTERDSQDNQDERASHLPNGDAVKPNGKLNGGPPERLHEMPNGVSSSTEADHDGDAWHEKYPRSLSRNSRNDSENQQTDGNHTRVVNGRPVSSDEGSFANAGSGHEVFHRLCGTTAVALTAEDQVDGAVESAGAFEDVDAEPAAQTSTPSETPATSAEYERPGRPRAGTDGALKVPNAANRASSPAAFQTPQSLTPTMTQHSQAPRLQQRHTLEVPRVSTTRLSREMTSATSPDDSVLSATGRFSPHTPRGRRGSMSLVRRATRSVASDLHLDDLSPDDDAARWAEVIRQKRASKRKRKEEEDEDRVVVGTKVDQNHVNWVTAYNMLTGIRFTVSRTNAKLDRELTDADFDAKHKFSFDITGNELTPSAKYDFKFKDYAPWVFRHLRAIFKLDPADYLMSLTSKYILSELGSPGKSGSFFYFSRDYKYIIKTIHHAEHKFLRKILRDYYNHVRDNPNTLLSQFYGLHRVKIPYGRKIHFVVMNNLFPPHRDIHRTFDLKGSTIGRDFQEDDLDKNPRATLKDLNWLRRNLHLEFGPTKKRAFVEQMERDVVLLERLHIMDYSLLVGIHDLERGNEDKLRDKTLQVFQPGGEDAEDQATQTTSNVLTRTPSKMETARKARELRQMIKAQRPIPMDQAKSGMPEELEEERAKKGFYFYQDDGGFRATHEDERPGEEIYYLGIIDCLTHYGLVKRLEHFWKGMSNPKSQISPVPPDQYGERFVRFINGITKTREAAELEKAEERGMASPELIDDPSLSGINMNAHPRSSESQTTPRNQEATDRVMEKAEKQARRSERHGADESNVPNKKLTSARSPSPPGDPGGYTLPVVEEDVEGQSTGGRSGRSNEPSPQPDTRRRTPSPQHEPPLSSELRLPSPAAPDRPPPTPPKERLSMPNAVTSRSSTQRPHTPQSQSPSVTQVDGTIDEKDDMPPTPPKDSVKDSMMSRGRSPTPNRDKALPKPPMDDDEESLANLVLRPLDAS